ncbi:L-seryl-tRNA(Sec) selenium transferase [Peptostreptococcaceae bacterium AGR-M142]
MSKREYFSLLPSVEEVLNNEELKGIIKDYPRDLIVEKIRSVIDNFRKIIVSSTNEELLSFELNIDIIIKNIIEEVKDEYELHLTKVINGTGVIIHTNLGRAPISESIKEDIWNRIGGYCNLEYDIQKGKRGLRYDHLENIIKKLTGAEDVLVVNNNAAAVLLVLSTLAKEKEVIVSRGELVEIGGSFRVPDVMEQGGAKLVEVGTTNKTHLKDYKNAINEQTAALMKVHTSNYKIMGFTKEVSLEELRVLADEVELPLIEDLGSGVFIDFSKYNLKYEPTVKNSIDKGVDIVTFSGDKILGGPQAGIIIGKSKYIKMMKENQLTRALRVDKLTIATLEATLRLYLDEQKAIENIPGLKMITMREEELETKANKLLKILNNLNLSNVEFSIEKGSSQVGGGALPLEYIDSKVINIKPSEISINKLEEKLRLSKSHIIGRVYDDKYILDVRTIFENEFEIVAKEITNIFN